jgi:hypothetical protein
MVVDGHHKPLISMELWNTVQKMLDKQKKVYPKYARRDQPIQYMLKGLVRCSECGATMAMSSTMSGKSKIRTLQCCNYVRGACHVSHSITMPKIENALVDGLKQAVGAKEFVIAPKKAKNTNCADIDYDKLIAVEERKLTRAQEAYLAEIDTIEQYARHKKEISEKIESLKAKRDNEVKQDIDIDAFSKKVADVVRFIQRDDASDTAKNEALRTVIEKIVYEKAKGNLAIYFHA